MTQLWFHWSSCGLYAGRHDNSSPRAGPASFPFLWLSFHPFVQSSDKGLLPAEQEEAASRQENSLNLWASGMFTEVGYQLGKGIEYVYFLIKKIHKKCIPEP